MKKDKAIEDIIDKFPLPSSAEYEEMIIADAIFSEDALPVIMGSVSSEMFSDRGCAEAWSIIRKMYDDGDTIDLTSFSGRCSSEMLTRVTARCSSVGSGMYIPGHCATLKDVYLRREAYKFAVKVIANASNKTTPTDDLLSIPDDFSKAIQSAISSSNMKAISDAINELGEELQEKATGKVQKVQTGFSKLDWLTYGGFGAGNLVILAARPSVGKTAVMLQMAKSISCNGIPTMLFSLEMTRKELAQRLMLSFGTIPGRDIASGKVDWPEFEECAGKFFKVPLYIDDEETYIDKIVSSIILGCQQKRCGAVLIDYLGLIDTNNRSQAPLHQVIASITRKLKLTAKRCGIPIVLLCQLNRAIETEHRPPMLNDLRDSGSIEQDADIVLMLEQVVGDNEYPLRMWVRKNRQGRAGMFIPLFPNETFTQFREGEPRRINE